MQQALQNELEAALREERSKLEHRLGAIQTDRRRKGAALEADFEEQAVQRENDETLDELDARGRRELQSIDVALGRIADGDYGECARCGEPISVARLRALPTAIHCVACADPKESESG
jgi:RNA polymerase-binding protein DksA